MPARASTVRHGRAPVRFRLQPGDRGAGLIAVGVHKVLHARPLGGVEHERDRGVAPTGGAEQRQAARAECTGRGGDDRRVLTDEQVAVLPVQPPAVRAPRIAPATRLLRASRITRLPVSAYGDSIYLSMYGDMIGLSPYAYESSM
jgi:hypothetical protein